MLFNLNESPQRKKQLACIRFLDKFIVAKETFKNINATYTHDKRNACIMINNYAVILVSCFKDLKEKPKYFIDKKNIIDIGIIGLQDIIEKLVKGFDITFD